MFWMHYLVGRRQDNASRTFGTEPTDIPDPKIWIRIPYHFTLTCNFGVGSLSALVIITIIIIAIIIIAVIIGFNAKNQQS